MPHHSCRIIHLAPHQLQAVDTVSCGLHGTGTLAPRHTTFTSLQFLGIFVYEAIEKV